MKPTAFALFDFDGTLCRGDSILPYLTFAVGRMAAPVGQLGRALSGYLDYQIDHSRDAEAKARALSFIQGRTRAEMDALAREFMEKKLRKRFFQDGLREMDRLRAEGKRIVVISASPEVYLRLLPEFMPVDAVLATPCTLDDSGCYTGEVPVNCRGEEKLRRLRRYLTENDLSIDRAASWSYGDSLGDRPMLMLTDHPTLVNPKKKLVMVMPGAKQVCWK